MPSELEREDPALIEEIAMLRCYARAHAIVTKTKDLGDIEQTYWTDKVFEVVKGIMDRRDASGA